MLGRQRRRSATTWPGIPADWRVLAGPRRRCAGPPRELRAELLTAVGADPATAEPVADPARLAGGQDPVTALRAGLPARGCCSWPPGT